MLEQQLDHLVAGLEVGIHEAELLEVLVLAHKVGGRALEQVEEALEVLTGEGLVEIANDVELDAALAEDLLRTARLASTRVVVHPNASHAARVASLDPRLRSAVGDGGAGMFELIIRGGDVLDGTGSTARRADVGIG